MEDPHHTEIPRLPPMPLAADAAWKEAHQAGLIRNRSFQDYVNAYPGLANWPPPPDTGPPYYHHPHPHHPSLYPYANPVMGRVPSYTSPPPPAQASQVSPSVDRYATYIQDSKTDWLSSLQLTHTYFKVGALSISCRTPYKIPPR